MASGNGVVDPSKRQALLQKVEARRAEYGGGSGGAAVRMGNKVPAVERISSGSFALDYATEGGIPRGRWTRMYGGFSSGKSLTCWNIIREAQALGLGCVYFNIEKQYDPAFTAACGVDVDELLIGEGTIIEEVGENLFDLLEGYHVFVIDSCSEAISTEEMSGEFGDKHYSPGPRAWNEVFKKVNEKFDPHEHTIIYLDQIRDVFGGQGGVQPPGGRLMEHRSSMTLFFRRGSWLFRNEKGRLVEEAEAGKTMHGLTEADGMEIKVRVEKSRVGRPFRQAVMRYDLDGARLDLAWELSVIAGYLDVDGNPAHRSGKPPIISKTTPKSSYFALPDGTTVQGMNGLAAKLEEDDDLKQTIAGALRAGW